MKGYWIILGAEVKDAQAQAEYARLWKPIGEHYGASIRVLEPDALKELTHASRALVVEFSSYEQARACYADPAYTEAKAHALRAADRQLIIIEGDLA
ncbi:DUF1330 domain-containing protein [Pseudomonas sp. 3A(2025)]